MRTFFERLLIAVALLALLLALLLVVWICLVQTNMESVPVPDWKFE